MVAGDVLVVESERARSQRTQTCTVSRKEVVFIPVEVAEILILEIGVIHFNNLALPVHAFTGLFALWWFE